LEKDEWRLDQIGYSDRTINRTMVHWKTFSGWIYKLRPFALGNPMVKLKLIPVGTGLVVARTITPNDARHAMDRHLIDYKPAISPHASIQRQLGLTNATYLMQYARITDNELENVLDNR
jgi:hypothetical protein